MVEHKSLDLYCHFVKFSAVSALSVFEIRTVRRAVAQLAKTKPYLVLDWIMDCFIYHSKHKQAKKTCGGALEGSCSQTYWEKWGVLDLDIIVSCAMQLNAPTGQSGLEPSKSVAQHVYWVYSVMFTPKPLCFVPCCVKTLEDLMFELLISFPLQFGNL